MTRMNEFFLHHPPLDFSGKTEGFSESSEFLSGLAGEFLQSCTWLFWFGSLSNDQQVSETSWNCRLFGQNKFQGFDLTSNL